MKLEYLKEDQRLFLERGYLREGETPEQRYKTICDTVEKYALKNAKTKKAKEYVKGISKRFQTYFEKGWPSLSTPVISNFGSKDNLPISCNFSILDDSLDDIYKGLHEIGMLAKYGAGTAVNFSNIRPIGSYISSGGKSNSVLDWIELYADMMSKTSQNRSRRGFLTAYLSVDNPEIMEFLDIGTSKMPADKQRFFQTITTAVTIPEGWRDDLKTNPKKREIFTKILNTRSEAGFPYILDLENANKQKHQVYKDKKMRLTSSNICCVTGETLILTKKGYVPIIDTVGKNTTVWNGEEWSEVIPFKASGPTDIYRVTTDSGHILDVTDNHNFYIKEKFEKSKTLKRSTLELKEGDKLIKFDLPLIKGDKKLLSPYTQGFFSGDGHVYRGRPFVNLYSEAKKSLIDRLDIRSKYKNSVGEKETGEEPYIYEGKEKTVVALNEELKSKNFVPGAEYTVKDRLEWLSGLLDSDGTIIENKQGERISKGLQISSVDKKFLTEVGLMLQTLGCNYKIKTLSEEGYKKLPMNDGSGKFKDYLCKKTYRLLVTHSDLYKLEKIGFKSYRLELNLDKPNRSAGVYTRVKSIEKLDCKKPTYCFTEPKRHMGMFNGILTGQSEISEYADYEKSFACCLSAVNLYYWDEFKNNSQFFRDMFILLDCVIEEYIEKGSKIKGLEKAVKFAKEHRSVGLGVTAFHTYLQKNMVPFGSLKSHSINNQIFSKIKEEADKANKWMGSEFGEPKILKGYGDRATSTIAIAPKKSTTFIDGGTRLGLSEGVEPHKTNCGEKKLAKIQVHFKNKELEKLLKKKGKNTSSVWKSIENNNGSVQHLDFLDNNEKEVFKTFSEISQGDVITLAANRQKYIDQAQSINIMVHPDTPPKEKIKLHIDAFDKGLKSLYYQYSISASQKFRQELMQCTSCEG